MNGNAIAIAGKLTNKTQKLNKTTKNKKRTLFIPRQKLMKIGVGILVLVIFAGSAISYVKAYDGKIYPKVVVAGVNVGGMTIDEGKSAVKVKAQELNDNGPIITYNDETLKPKLDEMGVTFNVDEAVNAAYQYGRAGSVRGKLMDNFETLTKQNKIDIKPQIDEEKFNEFLTQIQKQVEIPARDKQVEDGTGSILDEGQDGLEIDKVSFTDKIKGAVSSGAANVSIEVPTKVTERKTVTIYPHAQPGRYAGRYIDINLSEQTLYAFEGYNLVNQFLVSTGRSGYATPTGEFHVYGKDRSGLMDGPDYYLPNVPYISWWSGDYSIHGTYWHHNFGHVMSHGCINASIPDAEWIYNWDDIGTPVYIHYAED